MENKTQNNDDGNILYAKNIRDKITESLYAQTSVYVKSSDSQHAEITLPFAAPGGWRVTISADGCDDDFMIRGFFDQNGPREVLEIDMDDENERFLFCHYSDSRFHLSPAEGLFAKCTRDTLAETALTFGRLIQAIAFYRYFSE